MPFQKGQSGNPAGRSSDKLYLAALRMELAAVGENHRALRAIAKVQIAKAMEGDRYAIEHIAERIDGKVPQGIGGADELPPIKGIGWLNSPLTTSLESLITPETSSPPSTIEPSDLAASSATAEPVKP